MPSHAHALRRLALPCFVLPFPALPLVVGLGNLEHDIPTLLKV